MSNQKSKVLIINGDAAETVDTLYPILRVQEEGLLPVAAGPEQRQYQLVLHEIQSTGWDITREYEEYTLHADIVFRDTNPVEYVGIFFFGGKGTEVYTG